MTITALQEPRVAIVDDATGNVLNVIVADATWAQANACQSGQTAHDVFQMPIGPGWKFNGTDFYQEDVLDGVTTTTTLDHAAKQDGQWTPVISTIEP